MKRHVFKRLCTWQQARHRKPLLLMGARQVGKTTLIRTFGKTQYSNLVELNFDDRPQLKQIFEQDLDPKRIIHDIMLEQDAEINPNTTLIFLDEIQECPNALNALKYFNENANEYHVCGAGSLLGTKLSHTKGFPVGKVNFEKLYPLNYLEFLNAIGQTKLQDYLSSLTLDDTINPAIHEKLLGYLKTYYCVGGMPEAVSRYRENNNLNDARAVHQDIIHAYELDFVKHAPKSIITKINECFQSIPSQLAKENKKFIYSVIREGARARTYEDAIQWLVKAGLIHKVYQCSTPKLPLIAYENRRTFKAYLLDVGLINTMANLPMKTILQGNQLFQEFKGSLSENFVTQEIIQHQEHCNYWTSGNKAEIDYIIQQDDKIYPLETKSGTSSKMKSLAVYRDKYKPNLALRTSPQNLVMNNGFANIPLYLIGNLPYLLANQPEK